METLNRFERVAAEISKRHGVQVEWAPANREYVVEGRPCSGALYAEKIAKQRAIAMSGSYGWSQQPYAR
jgi:hypothetical protein